MDESAFRHNGKLTECALASIDVLHMDVKSGTTEPRPLKLLTTLDLPVTPCPAMFHPRSQWEAISMQTFSTPLTAETSGCQRINCRCGWHRAFDLMDEYRVLCITFDVWAGEQQGALFYIPFKTLLDCATPPDTKNNPTGVSIPWDEWAQNVTWLRGRLFGNAGASGAQHAYSQGDDTWPHADDNIYVHDLNPMSMKAARTARFDMRVPRNNLSIRWPNKENARHNKYTLAIMRSANTPILEACINYGDLRNALDNNNRSSVMIFEDSIMLLKQTTASYWKLEDGIILLT
ncbi:hypothetical protein BDV93DRAFT_528796, partial [Ceratobasidium sp. AG-I]